MRHSCWRHVPALRLPPLRVDSPHPGQSGCLGGVAEAGTPARAGTAMLFYPDVLPAMGSEPSMGINIRTYCPLGDTVSFPCPPACLCLPVLQMSPPPNYLTSLFASLHFSCELILVVK